jgi:hypothetical protein
MPSTLLPLQPSARERAAHKGRLLIPSLQPGGNLSFSGHEAKIASTATFNLSWSYV